MIQQLENLNVALKFSQSKGVPNNGCSSEGMIALSHYEQSTDRLLDLYDGNTKLILSFLWPLVVASYTGELIYVEGNELPCSHPDTYSP